MSHRSLLLAVLPAVVVADNHELPVWEIALAAGAGGLALLLLCFGAYECYRINNRKEAAAPAPPLATPDPEPPSMVKTVTDNVSSAMTKLASVVAPSKPPEVFPARKSCPAPLRGSSRV